MGIIGLGEEEFSGGETQQEVHRIGLTAKWQHVDNRQIAGVTDDRGSSVGGH